MDVRQSEPITVGEPMPVIASLQHIGSHTVTVTWAEGPRAGMTDTVDLGPAVLRYRIFAPLGDVSFFATGTLAEDGNVILWETRKGPVEMPATLVEHYASLGDFDHMSADRFRDWMNRHDMTLDEAAEALGVARRLIAYYRSGEREIPRTVALACAGYDAVTRHAA